MAKKTVSLYYSDLSGEDIAEGNPTVSFAFDGVSYEIDLTTAEKAAMREAFSQYIALGRRVSTGRRAGSSRAASTSGPAPADVRAWAQSQGLDVPARGRIPAAISEAYAAAH